MVGIIGRPIQSRLVRGMKKENIINTVKNRFYSKALLPNENGCMIWIGSKLPTGYGQFTYERKTIKAHRYSYLLHYGRIKKDHYVCHRCDNPSCIAPEHLFLGLPKDNVNDMYKKGRQASRKGINNGMSKLNDEKVKGIKKSLLENKLTITEIGRKFGISYSVIHEIREGRAWGNIVI